MFMVPCDFSPGSYQKQVAGEEIFVLQNSAPPKKNNMFFLVHLWWWYILPDVQLIYKHNGSQWTCKCFLLFLNLVLRA